MFGITRTTNFGGKIKKVFRRPTFYIILYKIWYMIKYNNLSKIEKSSFSCQSQNISSPWIVVTSTNEFSRFWKSCIRRDSIEQIFKFYVFSCDSHAITKMCENDTFKKCFSNKNWCTKKLKIPSYGINYIFSPGNFSGRKMKKNLFLHVKIVIVDFWKMIFLKRNILLYTHYVMKNRIIF